jgi:hypothetical protein
MNNGSNKSWMKSNCIDAKQPACSMQWTSLLRKIEDGTRGDRSRLSRRLQGIRACQLTSRSGGCRLIIPSCAKQAGNVKKRCTTKSCCVAIRRRQACSSWKGEGGATLRQGAWGEQPRGISVCAEHWSIERAERPRAIKSSQSAKAGANVAGL